MSVLGTMLSGGVLFDEGMYGCIFRPSLRCKDPAKQPPLTKNKIHPPLSKIILTEDAIVEDKISKIIRTIPIWKNHFAVAESMCEPAEKQTDPEFSKCEAITKYKMSDFRILSMSYYGKPMASYQFKWADFNFMDFITHLIKGGALLCLFGVAHRDIHQGNLLIDQDYVPRIIDFNLAIMTERPVTADDLAHTYALDISQEPPDSTLINAVERGYSPNKVIPEIIYKKQILKKIRNILGISAHDMYRELSAFYQKSKIMKEGNTVNWFTLYWTTIDSWAIGCIIVDLISKLSLWPSFETILGPHKLKLFTLLKKMCAVSPIDRVDCVQALYYLNPQDFIIRKYGKAWIAKIGDGKIRISE